MNKFAILYVAAIAALTGLYPAPGFAQQPPAKRNLRPAARPVAAPAPAKPKVIPSATPDTASHPDKEANHTPPLSEDPADTAEPTTVIDAYESTTFTSKDRIVVFKGKVKVVDPRFQLVCDELTVFLNKTNQSEPGAAPAPGATPAQTPTPAPSMAAGSTPPAGDKSSGGGGIDHAIAKGHVIILQKRAATKDGGEEKISIGRGEEGTFDNKTGDMTLKGTPSIEQNGNTHVATSPDTVMTIHRDGGLATLGPAQTNLVQRKGGGGFDLPGGPGATDGTKNGKAAAPQASPGVKRPAATPKPHG